MSRSTDDLYAVYLDNGAVLHGKCAEERYPDGLPEDATPVFYGDTWRGEVSGLCAKCELFVDPGVE